jgi:predicted AlkP superfamily pyrophosphatase or phosphodiesterase
MSAKRRVTCGSEWLCCEIRVRGPMGPTTMQAFPALTATRSGYDTLLTGSLPDQSALYGVINQLDVLGLQLLEIRRPKCGGSGTKAKSHDRCEHDSARLA